MTTAVGNARLRAARQALGIRSQAALADAVTDTARSIGLRVSINPRTVRRWESASPPWPHPDHARALESLFQRPLEELGFTPPWADAESGLSRNRTGAYITRGPKPAHPSLGTAAIAIPSSVATDYASITACYRHLYWTLPPARLHRSVAEHSHLGAELIAQVPSVNRPLIAAAVSEVSLLSGRLEFFDLQQPELSRPSFTRALEAAHEASDLLLGSAALAHMAFAPAFSGDPGRAEEARERIRGARAFARRADGPAQFLGWLDAVEAEVETRFGDTRLALRLIHHAEQVLASADDKPLPEWFDWFSEARLAGFKGNTLMVAGQGRAARETLKAVLNGLPEDAAKQRAITLADLAAAAIIEKQPERACEYIESALDQLGHYWYATGMDRVKTVRSSLRAYESLPAVKALDERLYDWHTTLNAVVG